MSTRLCFVLILLCSTSCYRHADKTLKIPFLYRVEIQQGNVIDQPMLAQLEIGMTKEQVSFILGTPVLIDPFNNNRWDYIYTFKSGSKGFKSDEILQEQSISIHFKEDKFARTSGDVTVFQPDHTTLSEEKAIIVPDKKPLSFWQSFIKKINPFD